VSASPYGIKSVLIHEAGPIRFIAKSFMNASHREAMPAKRPTAALRLPSTAARLSRPAIFRRQDEERDA